MMQNNKNPEIRAQLMKQLEKTKDLNSEDYEYVPCRYSVGGWKYQLKGQTNKYL